MFRNLLRSPVFIIVILLVFIVAAGATVLWIVEHKSNPNFSTIPDSIWSIFVYLFSGLEDRGPETTLGKIVAIFIFLSGVSVMGMIYGRITAWLIKLENLKGGLMSIEQFSDHYIICNYSPKADKIIEELHSGVIDWRRIIVISENEHELSDAQRGDKRFTRDVIFATGAPHSVDMLRNADTHKARAVIILADENTPDPDGESAMICLAIEQLMAAIRDKDPGAKKPHVIVEAVNHRKLEHLHYAGADEVISNSDVGLKLLSQAAITPYIGEIYNHLTSVGSDTNEIYSVTYDKLPPAIRGKTYTEICRFFVEYNASAIRPVTPIGVARGRSFLINPTRDSEISFGALSEGDSVLFIAFEPPIFK